MLIPNALLSLLLHTFFGLIAFSSSVKDFCINLFCSQRPLHCTAPHPPRHLTIIFPPQHKNPAVLQKDILRLVSACLQLGISQLSIFDTFGIAKNSLQESLSDSILAQYSSTLSLQPHGRKHVLTFLSNNTTSSSSSSLCQPISPDGSNTKLVIRLLDFQDGQPCLADIARDLADACLAKHIEPSDISQPVLSEKLATIMPEPDLLIIFGGSSLKLYGYPPWHLRVTEIFHIPSSILSTPHATQSNIQSALDAFSACTQRHGR